MSPVLVVDDSLTVRMDLSEALQEQGLDVLACADLEAARQVLRAPPLPSLVILDVLLPDGDGINFLRELRSTPATSRLPVLLLSSEAEVAHRVTGLVLGADDYLGKPYDRDALVARALVLARSETRRGPLVLVVDDSTTYRASLREALEGLAYTVVEAETGEEGLRLASELCPDAMLVDGVLPGIDGTTVIRRIRLDANLRRTPCVLLTASDEQDAELRAFDAGADAFVRKDGEADLVLARLGAVLRTVTVTSSAPLTPPPTRRCLLAVDDSVSFLELLTDMLRERFDVMKVSSGEEALEVLAREPVDCVLLDRIMPGMGGEEACRRIKSAPGMRDIPLIMLTALEDRDAMIEGLSAGADDYIAKSSDLAVLEARILAQIRRKQFEDEHRRLREQLVRNELEVVEARAARTLAETRAALLEDLERKNRELEAFSYSVSHDLRAPLRSIDGFSQVLLEEYSEGMDETGRDYLQRVRAATKRMTELIDDLLELSRIGRAELRAERLDFTALVHRVVAQVALAEPERQVRWEVAPNMFVQADARLLQIVLENLLGNAWKFTARISSPRIEIGLESADPVTLFVRDNGVGFDMAYASKLFAPFQRLHRADEFPGTGIGLATVARIVDRHGGRIWAESAPGQGTTFRFTLPSGRSL